MGVDEVEGEHHVRVTVGSTRWSAKYVDAALPVLLHALDKGANEILVCIRGARHYAGSTPHSVWDFFQIPFGQQELMDELSTSRSSPGLSKEGLVWRRDMEVGAIERAAADVEVKGVDEIAGIVGVLLANDELHKGVLD